MKPLLRLLGLPALLLSLVAQAQTTPLVLTPQPLGADPSRAASAAATSAGATLRTAALGLPFFEDFTLPRDGQPSPLRWQPATTNYPDGGGLTQHYGGGGAYVSNRLASEPLTRGTVTLDGLRANGQPYAPTSASLYSATDTLTSQPIDLSTYSPANNLYLSYAWQAGTLAGSPVASGSGSPVFLTLEFLDKDGRWNTIWTYNAEGKTTRFSQKIFPLNQAGYFHSGFRFRFRASGNQSSSRDAFGLDYIYLNTNRAPNDTIFQDIATSRGLNSPLQNYTAMPVWQYAASTASPLNPALTATINNLLPSGNPTPISWQGTVSELTSGGFSGTWVTGNQPLLAGARQVVITGDARTAPLPAATSPRRYRYTLALQTNETNPLTLPNDTTYRDLELADYYAFDDGTAESFLPLQALSTGPISYYAYPITAAKGDQVQGVRLAPIFNNIPLAQGGENFQNRSVTVAVWADKNGQPADQPLATRTLVLPNPLPTKGQVFIDVNFSTPVPVSGRFYFGYGQASTGQFLPYGFDLNNASTAPTLYYNRQNTWSTPPLSTPGTIMMRAVMNNNIVLATQAQQAANARFSLYPNPAPSGTTTVAVSGPTFRRAAVLDVLGRPVWQQPATEAGQPTLRLPSSLAAGMYLVQLTLPDGSIATRRLAVE
jgi:hypothetical protein